ncbi:venom serine carboxypeptidase-like [Cylas formicarius]|uniref:venom serine carboxypeptidase-like n=1 Tax=Cylas formicarius TaxID=197179 RepID=UPI00295898DD|nr:venom serine carboxypeptidase-like [Cylas formicarius]
MSLKQLALIFVLLILDECECRFQQYHKKFKRIPLDGDPGEPLILTPLLRQNRVQEAREDSRVVNERFFNVTSFSGYFTVDETYDSNLFFWFFPSENNYTSDPVVLWLQGGPGASSLLALFTENGPFIVSTDYSLTQRSYYWSQYYSVLFIDSPAGTGFSFTNGGYAQNQTKVGVDLYNALLQFFQLFPELKGNDFYVSGESYAGKYIPAIAYTILRNNPDAEQEINLKGLLIGNGLSDPQHQFEYGDYLYQIGLIDSNTRDTMKAVEDSIIQYIREGNYQKAVDAFSALILGDEKGKETTIFENATGFESHYNYLKPKEEYDYWADLVQRSDLRLAIHVGNTTFGDDRVRENLVLDITKSVAPWISELLDHYRVLTYNGQLDIIVAYPLTENYLKYLNFSGAEEYSKAARVIWKVDGEIAGYYKKGGKLTEAIVRNAGHMVPGDQPKWALDLVKRFISDTL